MRHIIFIAVLFLVTFDLQAAGLNYSQDVSTWQEVIVPTQSNKAPWVIWSRAANLSKHNWKVFIANREVCAQLIEDAPELPISRPEFEPIVDEFKHASTFSAVDDGWLVGFNYGEFGGALYWFSHDGKENYKISDHQIVDFFVRPDGIYAIEGLSHLGLSKGSIIHLSKRKKDFSWVVDFKIKLSSAPELVSSISEDGTMLITLYDSIITFDSHRKIKTLLKDAPWVGLYPNSSMITEDKQILYIGMRQFVGEFDLLTNKLRLLIPSEEFLNKFSEEKQYEIRELYGE